DGLHLAGEALHVPVGVQVRDHLLREDLQAVVHAVQPDVRHAQAVALHRADGERVVRVALQRLAQPHVQIVHRRLDRAAGGAAAQVQRTGDAGRRHEAAHRGQRHVRARARGAQAIRGGRGRAGEGRVGLRARGGGRGAGGAGGNGGGSGGGGRASGLCLTDFHVRSSEVFWGERMYADPFSEGPRRQLRFLVLSVDGVSSREKTGENDPHAELLAAVPRRHRARRSFVASRSSGALRALRDVGGQAAPGEAAAGGGTAGGRGGEDGAPA